MTECSICYSTLTPSTTFTTCCNHSFHRECVTQWIAKQAIDSITEIGTCPLCRTQISAFGYLFYNASFFGLEQITGDDDDFYLSFSTESIVY